MGKTLILWVSHGVWIWILWVWCGLRVCISKELLGGCCRFWEDPRSSTTVVHCLAAGDVGGHTSVTLLVKAKLLLWLALVSCLGTEASWSLLLDLGQSVFIVSYLV